MKEMPWPAQLLLPPSRSGGPGGLLLWLPLLLLLAGRVALAQNWRNENYERPIDLEGSADDDSFEDEEVEEFYSGSGSGYFDQDSRIKTVVRLTTDTSLLFAPTSAVLPVTSVQPVATPFAPFYPEEPTSSQATSGNYVPRMTEAPAVTIRKAPENAISTTAQDDVTPSPVTTAATTVVSTTTSLSSPTSIPKALPPVITIVATTPSITLETPTAATTVDRTEETTTSLATTSVTKIRTRPKPGTSLEPYFSERSTTVSKPASSTAPTEPAQVEPLDVTLSTAVNNELEVPVSGDFEIREEEEVIAAQTQLSNEVVALVTPAAEPGLRKNMESGLLDNTIDSGNSAAQLPQKNILERKEVLIAVIVGGVVGALFAAFLVMLLIYRMKKKDEGSYTLEEPKQASVTYQKPDKQEEFYA
uniref:Syndecan n=1 Tax=Salvator merianae TaxID=96440 RepID=A0A8D0B7C4_SALMN